MALSHHPAASSSFPPQFPNDPNAPHLQDGQSQPQEECSETEGAGSAASIQPCPISHPLTG